MGHIIKTADGVSLYVKDWGAGRPVVLIHGWPLNADSWEYQAVRLAENGFRVVAYDRRGFGRSEQPFKGYDYDTLADDLASVIDGLHLRDVALAGFSMGGGEVARYMSRHHGQGVKKAMLVSSIAPGVLQRDDVPDGVPAEMFDQMQSGLRRDRPGFLWDFLAEFYGQGTTGGGVSDAMLRWSWGMGMMASPKATLDCVGAFGHTDLRGDMASFDVPTLVVHGTADRIVPIGPTARAAAAAIKGAQLKEYEDAPHGLPATHAERLYDDMLRFLKE